MAIYFFNKTLEAKYNDKYNNICMIFIIIFYSIISLMGLSNITEDIIKKDIITLIFKHYTLLLIYPIFFRQGRISEKTDFIFNIYYYFYSIYIYRTIYYIYRFILKMNLEHNIYDKRIIDMYTQMLGWRYDFRNHISVILEKLQHQNKEDAISYI